LTLIPQRDSVARCMRKCDFVPTPPDLRVPPALENPDEAVAATLRAIEQWHATPDGRLSPRPAPGILELRVAPGSVDRALRMFQAVVVASQELGMDVRGVVGARHQRPGVGIGRGGIVTALDVEELRSRVAISGDDLEEYLRRDLRWILREDELRDRGWVPMADGRLRIVLPRRFDRPPEGIAWCSRFSDQVGRPLEAKLQELLVQLDARSRAAPAFR
jgi:hypothetical protein